MLYSIFAYFVFPISVAFWTIPNLMEVYASVGSQPIILTMLFGFGWGVAVVLFGLGVDMVGLGLTGGIIYGTSVAVGSIVPLLILDASKLATMGGWLVVIAVVVMMFGVASCSWAGDLREKLQSSQENRPKRTRFVRGIVICFAAGFLSTLFNIALTYGEVLTEAAIETGADPFYAANAVWGVTVSTGSIPSIGYCLWLLRRNKTWFEFKAFAPRNAMLCLTMALLWILGTVLYGSSAGILGKLEPVIGWPVYMSAMILGQNVWGWWIGEWKGVSGKPVTVMVWG